MKYYAQLYLVIKIYTQFSIFLLVGPTSCEPSPGWINNLYGPVGITVSILSGLLRVGICDPDVNANLIPADFTVNALIASAWDVFNNPHRYDKRDIHMSGVENPIKNNGLCKMVNKQKLMS